MPFIDTNGTRLYYEIQGSGPPIVFAHGAWGDHHVWDGIVPRLTDGFTTFTYDRRGHSQSQAPTGPQGIAEDVDDLASMLSALNIAPVHLVGTSGGAAMSLHFAARHPEMLTTVVVHEPPFLGLAEQDPQYADVVAETRSGIDATNKLIAAGDYEKAAEEFLDNVAIGPGAWQQLPDPLKQVYAANAPAFLDDGQDPLLEAIEISELSTLSAPMLITRGGQSPPYYRGTFDRLKNELPNAEFFIFEEAGHSPYRSHPDKYVQKLREFIADVDDRVGKA